MTDVVIMIWSRITTCKRCIEVINGKMALERCRIEDGLILYQFQSSTLIPKK
jgi:hypothetical protein